jgi:hypothetical protein
MIHVRPIIVFVLLAAARSASACTVCFGDPASGLARGFYWGILVLLILPFAITGAFVAAVAYRMRKNRINRATVQPS